MKYLFVLFGVVFGSHFCLSQIQSKIKKLSLNSDVIYYLEDADFNMYPNLGLTADDIFVGSSSISANQFLNYDLSRPSYEYLWIMNDGKFGHTDIPIIKLHSSMIQGDPQRMYTIEIYNGHPPPASIVDSEVDVDVVSSWDDLEVAFDIGDIDYYAGLNSHLNVNGNLEIEAFHPDLRYLDGFQMFIITIKKPTNSNGSLKLYFNKPVRGEDVNGNSYYYNESNASFSSSPELIFPELTTSATEFNNVTFHDFKHIVDIDLSTTAVNSMKTFFVKLEVAIPMQSFVSNDEMTYYSEVMAVLESDTTVLNLPKNHNNYNLSDIDHWIEYEPVHSKIVGAHDPNTLSLETCKCKNTDGVYEIEAKIEFTNDGDRPTNNVKVQMNIPDEIDMSSINFSSGMNADVPGLDNIDIRSSNGQLLWTFNNQTGSGFLPFKGSGGKACISFVMKTKSNVSLTDIPNMFAKVSFGNGTWWETNHAKVNSFEVISHPGKRLCANINCNVISPIPNPKFISPWARFMNCLRKLFLS